MEEINAEGGDIQFELRIEDDESDPEKAYNCYNKLTDWGMQLSLVSVTSKPAEAISVNLYEDRIFGLTPLRFLRGSDRTRSRVVSDVLHRP